MNRRKIILIIFVASLFISCNKERQITEQEKDEIVAELDQIRTIDQKYAGIPSADF